MRNMPARVNMPQISMAMDRVRSTWSGTDSSSPSQAARRRLARKYMGTHTRGCRTAQAASSHGATYREKDSPARPRAPASPSSPKWAAQKPKTPPTRAAQKMISRNLGRARRLACRIWSLGLVMRDRPPPG